MPTKPTHRRTHAKDVRKSHHRRDAMTSQEIEKLLASIPDFSKTQKIDRKELKQALGKGRKKHKRNTRRRKSHKKKKSRRQRRR
tara:strand:+ start:5364 stop:5615 length:252 start_codon:yes stop_codon:yes gene_type:complete